MVKIKRSKNLNIYILNGILYAIMFNLYSPFAVKFLERLGGSEFDISLFNALPGLVAVFATLPGTLIVSKCYNKKKISALFFFISRFMLLGLAFIPQFPAYMAPMLFVIMISLRNFPESVSQTALQSFSGDLFTPEERSNAITLRSRYSIPATLLVTFAAGLILNKLPSTPAQTIKIYQLFFIVSFVIGMIETAVFMLIKEPESTCVPVPDMKKAIANVFKDKQFLRFTKITLIFYFTWQMGWPIFSIYQIITHGADEWWLSWISIFSSVAMFSGYAFWNKVIQEKGNRYALWVIAIGMAVNPVLLLISPNLYAVTAISLFSGFFTAGTLTVLLNALLEVTPDEHRVVYIGVYNTLVNVSLAISPFAAHAILNKSNIYIALAVVAVLRFISSGLFFLYDRKTSGMGAEKGPLQM